MSNARLATLDARLHRAFAARGIADVGEYRASALAAPFAQPIRCMVDRGSAQQGFGQQGSYSDVTVRLILQPGFVPAVGGLIDITGERFELRAIVEEDESAMQFAVVSKGPVPEPEDAP
jgi:hypothetical protein